MENELGLVFREESFCNILPTDPIQSQLMLLRAEVEKCQRLINNLDKKIDLSITMFTATQEKKKIPEPEVAAVISCKVQSSRNDDIFERKITPKRNQLDAPRDQHMKRDRREPEIYKKRRYHRKYLKKEHYRRHNRNYNDNSDIE